MSSFRGEKEGEKHLMTTLNILITIILGIGILMVWFDHRQDLSSKISIGVLYFLTLTFYILIP